MAGAEIVGVNFRNYTFRMVARSEGRSEDVKIENIGVGKYGSKMPDFTRALEEISENSTGPASIISGQINF